MRTKKMHLDMCCARSWNYNDWSERLTRDPRAVTCKLCHNHPKFYKAATKAGMIVPKPRFTGHGKTQDG